MPAADSTAEADADGALLTRGADTPGDQPERRAEAGEPEPARDTAPRETAAGDDRTGALSPPAPNPAAGGNEAESSGAKARPSAGSHTDTAAETGETTDGPQSACDTATPGDTPKAEAEADVDAEAEATGKAAETRSDAEDSANTEAGAAQVGTAAVAAGDTDTEGKAGQKADDTQVLPMPARTAAEPESDTGADGTAAAAPASKASAPGSGPRSGTRPTPDAEAPSAPDAAAGSDEPERGPRRTAGTGKETGPGTEPDDAPASRTGTAAETDEEAGCTPTLTKPTSDRAKAGTKPATRADAPGDGTKAEDTPASTADSDGGAGDTRTVAFRAPEAAATGRKPKTDTATDASGDDSKALSDASKKAWPAVRAEGADEPGGGLDARGRQNGSAAEATAEDDGRKLPARAGGEESDSERTSRFVALKPLDVPAPAAPGPQPHPQAPAPTTPKAPLDLLAELTNTPSPQETPRRTALRRVKVWTPILLLLGGAYAGAQLLRPLPTPRVVAAETAHTVDGQFSIPWPAKGQGAVRVPGSGDVGAFGDQKPVPTASVAKVMTAYVILKGHPLRKNDPGPDITVDAKAVADGNSENESRIQGLTAGTKFSQQDMLKMLMIPSGNNAARLLARWDTGSDSEAAFVEKMNAAARDLGMKDTTYTDPSGLDAGTVSTATDQLKLAEAVMKDEVFRTIVAMPSAPIKGLAQPLVNNNELLSVQSLSVRGIKTGSSTPAGGTLMWAAYKSVGDETPLILGTLMEQHVEGSDPNATKSLALVQTNSKKIIEAVRTALASTPLVRKGDTVGYVDDGLGGRTPLVATKDLNVIGVPGQQFKLAVAAGASPLPHKAKAGTEVGILTAGVGEGAKSVPVAVRNAVAEPSVGTRLTRLG
ncbi:serine hydrolase [Streptomyces sp. NPDC097981]|uniref:D-alanyl-D-alanine carboxypeptidase n=1 Tax=Streptomyces sp. NPDC097981 TaxID=3155428 RepID=UPI00332D065F